MARVAQSVIQRLGLWPNADAGYRWWTLGWWTDAGRWPVQSVKLGPFSFSWYLWDEPNIWRLGLCALNGPEHVLWQGSR
jgi:hypothetical protein